MKWCSMKLCNCVVTKHATVGLLGLFFCKFWLFRSVGQWWFESTRLDTRPSVADGWAGAEIRVFPLERDRPTDGRTDKASYRVVSPRLKRTDRQIDWLPDRQTDRQISECPPRESEQQIIIPNEKKGENGSTVTPCYNGPESNGKPPIMVRKSLRRLFFF